MKRIFAILLVSASLTACASIQSTKVQSDGNKITKEQAETIKPGATSKNTIIGTFGNPKKTETKSDGTEILTYAYTEKKTPTYFGEFIVNERQSKVATTTLEITIKDGVVQSYNFKKQEEE